MNLRDRHQLSNLSCVRVTADELEDMELHPAWLRMKQGIIDVLDDMYAEIVATVTTEAKTNVLRGQIQALEFVLSIPEQTKSEIADRVETPTLPDENTNEFVEKLTELKGKQNG